MSETKDDDKERGSHSYIRPKDAATLILVDRSGSVPKVLVGKRHDNIVFMPGKFVFPGGSVDTEDHKTPIAANIPKALEKKLTSGSPLTTPSRARALAVAAIREVCEETGLCLGKVMPRAKIDTAKLTGAWKPFVDASLLPDPSTLFMVARAVTPPGNMKRFDTRFFTADISAITHKVEGVVHADAELVELLWIELDTQPLADMHRMTRMVLGELNTRLAKGPLSHAADVPYFHFYNGEMRRDTI